MSAEPKPMTEDDRCPLCGQELGTGTLLDAHPNPPQPNPGSIASVALPAAQWKAFAARYRCPTCANFDPA
jgi:hypothetical protein